MSKESDTIERTWGWIIPYLVEAIDREYRFMQNNKESWIEDLNGTKRPT